MLKILLPTDFSDASINAIDYAIKLYENHKEEMSFVFMHAVFVHGTTVDTIRSKEDVLLSEATRKLEQLCQKYQEKHPNAGKFSIEARLGEVSYQVKQLVEEQGFDLIVMGTKGASGLKKVLIGSNATEVLKNRNCPTIIVPHQAPKLPITKILYACDFTEIDHELDFLVQFAKVLGAEVHLVHFYPEALSEVGVDVKETRAKLVKQYGYDKIKLFAEMENRVVDGILRYAEENKADLVVMFTEERSYLNELFGKSMTKELAFIAAFPLMAIPRKPLDL